MKLKKIITSILFLGIFGCAGGGPEQQELGTLQAFSTQPGHHDFSVTRMVIGIPGYYESEELSDLTADIYFDYDETGALSLGALNLTGYSSILGTELQITSDELVGAIDFTTGEIEIATTPFVTNYADPTGTLGTILCKNETGQFQIQFDIELNTNQTASFDLGLSEDMSSFTVENGVLVGSPLLGDLPNKVVLVGSVTLSESVFIEASQSSIKALDGETLFIQLEGVIE